MIQLYLLIMHGKCYSSKCYSSTRCRTPFLPLVFYFTCLEESFFQLLKRWWWIGDFDVGPKISTVMINTLLYQIDQSKIAVCWSESNRAVSAKFTRADITNVISVFYHLGCIYRQPLNFSDGPDNPAYPFEEPVSFHWLLTSFNPLNSCA